MQTPSAMLIVNADDFGLSPEVNRAVERAHREGILTSATLLANAPAFDDAVRIARDNPGLGVGAHLNLVNGRPLSPADEIPLLVDSDGRFLHFRLRRLTRDFLAQAEKEYRRQLEKIRNAGIVPTHVDFEKHHAWQGPLYMLACRVANDAGVRAARLLREPVAWSGRALGWPGLGRIAGAALLRSGFDLGGGGGKRLRLRHPDRLLGQSHIGKMTEDVWLRLIEKIPPGISEVMTHPGCPPDGETRADPLDGLDGGWLGKRREIELAALLSAKVRSALNGQGVRLVHFGSLAE